MLSRKFSPRAPQYLVFLWLLLVAMPSALSAQQPEAPAQPSAQAQTSDAPVPPATQDEKGDTVPAAEQKTAAHRFWDKQNCWLFAGVLGARYLDFASTLNARRRGLNEGLLNNETVDNHGAFAAIEFAGAATSVGVSYLFHRGGHHKLERWTSYVHIGVTVFGAARNYALKTPHPAPAPVP